MVCASILETTGIELNPVTHRMYVQMQHIGTGALKVENPGRITTFTFEVIKESFVTYINILQFEWRTLARATYFSICVNAVVNFKPGEQERTDHDPLYRIKRESALQFTVRKKKEEEMHIRWMTWTNTDSWFDGAKKMMLDLEFPHEWTSGETEHDGEVHIDEKNRRRIVDIDEYIISLDRDSGNSGGRPSFTIRNA
jgi:hypothetical protein